MIWYSLEGHGDGVRGRYASKDAARGNAELHGAGALVIVTGAEEGHAEED